MLKKEKRVMDTNRFTELSYECVDIFLVNQENTKLSESYQLTIKLVNMFQKLWLDEMYIKCLAWYLERAR